MTSSHHSFKGLASLVPRRLCKTLFSSDSLLAIQQFSNVMYIQSLNLLNYKLSGRYLDCHLSEYLLSNLRNQWSWLYQVDSVLCL